MENVYKNGSSEFRFHQQQICNYLIAARDGYFPADKTGQKNYLIELQSSTINQLPDFV